MADPALAQPLIQPIQEEFVRKLLAPDGGELLAGLDQRPIQVEQLHKAGH